MAKKVIFTEKQIKMLTESEIMKMKQDEEKLGTVTKEDIEAMLGKDLGDEEDKKIEYPSQSDIEAMKMDSDSEAPAEDNVSVEDMKGAPELLEYLDKLEEAKSILSKIAAKEENENIKNRIYAHYDKTQKVIFELIKEFGIVH
jgi:Cft2 family RNA processing exonuclease